MTFLRISALLAAAALAFGTLTHFVTINYEFIGASFSNDSGMDVMDRVRGILWLLNPFYWNVPLMLFFIAFFFNKPKEAPQSLPQ